jgi:hypothetical protein
MKEKLDQLACEHARQMREACGNTPYEEKVTLLIDRGWHRNKPHKLEGPEGPFYLESWGHRERDILGWTVDMAWKSEKRQTAKEQLEAAYADRTTELHCNKCGENMKRFSTDADGETFCVGYYGLVDAELSGGFYSDPLSDCTTYRFSLCEKCVMELFETFKVPPHVETYP